MSKNIQNGFTLIELSIVLVIIGLIVGGVLVGRDLIAAAEARAQISQLEKVETAIYAFKSKYGGLPGDISNATVFFGTTDASGYTVANGDGDGKILSKSIYNIGYCISSYPTNFGLGAVAPNEVEEVFHHLSIAGLTQENITPPSQYVGTNLTNIPNAVLGGGMIVTCLDEAAGSYNGRIPANFATGTGIMIGLNPGTNYYSTRIQYTIGWAAQPTPLVLPDMAERVDSKIDDGLPTTGKAGVEAVCNFNAYPPSTYQAMSASCGVAMVKKLWN